MCWTSAVVDWSQSSFVIDVPETPRPQHKRDRMHAPDWCTDDSSGCTLLAIHVADSSWAIHGPGAPGVRLSKAEMITLVEKILERAR
jgi:hypothetical protein